MNNIYKLICITRLDVLYGAQNHVISVLDDYLFNKKDNKIVLVTFSELNDNLKKI